MSKDTLVMITLIVLVIVLIYRTLVGQTERMVTPETLQEGRRLFNWYTVDNRNFVGPNRVGAIGFGKKGSALECSQNCISDKYCDYWSYNKRTGDCNGHNFMPVSAGVALPDESPSPDYISGRRFSAI